MSWYTNSAGFYVNSECDCTQCSEAFVHPSEELTPIDDDEATVLMLKGEIREQPR